MENKSNNRVEEIISSIDGIKPVDAPVYFYTRLRARMENELVEEKLPFFLLRPAFLTASLSLLFIINMIFLFQPVIQGPAGSNQGNSASIESFADAYNFNNTTVYQ